MKSLMIFAMATLVASCTTSHQPLEPIPGSITYGGQPRTKLMKSPIGSTFEHEFRGDNGTRWSETYQIQPDRTVEIISRRKWSDFEFFSDTR
ncbi:hypothetical protein [Rhizobium sp. Root482]|uniref:hypothetical protein n=1 Tax=Rhizobium sp. Root482 TaxID=1736543 RepID=UPI0006F202F0|nr:hypothetical protein [Rhizobium sp. Root482]KQY21115.1 hypothetical protein ASD31_23470 [Rhizobium sp. Root482]